MARSASASTSIEIRPRRGRERRLRYAAKLSRQSVQAFVLDAATERAEQVIASAAHTTVPIGFFDSLWRALAQPPSPNPALARRAHARPRFSPR